MKEHFIILHTNCKIVKGAFRSCIYDLQRNQYYLIPNSLASLFDEGKALNINKVKDKLDAENKSIFNDYIVFLKEKEMIFHVSSEELSMFPDLSLKWDYPASISHMTIDSNKDSNHDFEYYFKHIALEVNCRHMQIRFFDSILFSELEKIMDLINKTFIKSVDFFIKLKKVDDNYITLFVKKNKKIRSLIIHSQKVNKVIYEGEHNVSRIMSIQQKINDETHCGFIHSNYFSINIETYTEGLNYNSCLNRKLSIDKKGYIKNCSSMKKHFGHVSSVKIKDVISDSNFTNLWSITKDSITKCKDCEFRLICTDCRAYLEDPNDLYSAPLKCGYNPYTCEWEEWSTNPLKQKAIDFYGMREMVEKEK